MGDLTKNFSRKEFKCKCGCDFDSVDFELVNVLQDMVNHFTKKYNCRVYCKITGGNRCVSHNEAVQLEYNRDYISFSSNSQHLFARASDFKVYKIENSKRNKISPVEVYDYLYNKYTTKYGIGYYQNRNHLDTRSTKKSRWGMT